MRAAAWFCAVLTANFTLRPLRDAMGVAAGSDALPWLFTATFVAMLVVVPIHGRLVARLGRARLVAVVHRGFAVQLLGFYVLLAGHLDPLFATWLSAPELVHLWTARVLFVWTSVFNLIVISLFWSVMADLFTAADARRLFGLISVGGSVGAIAGPALGGLLAWRLGVAWVPVVAALLLELAVWAGRGLDPGPGELEVAEHPREPSPIGGGAWDGVRELLGSPLLLGICAYVLLLTVASTTVYFVQARVIAAEFVDDRTRTSVFAAIDLAVNLTSVAAQALLTARMIRRIGLGWTLAALPCLCAVGFVGLAAAPVLATLVGFQLVRRASDYALARPAREALYTAVDRSRRFKAKLLIDTVVYRGGDALTGWAFAGLEAVGLSLAAVALAVVPLMGAWAGLGVWLGRTADARSVADLDPEAGEDR